MLKAFDIETMPNLDVIELLPEPALKLGNIKDPAKIEQKRELAKREQIERMALNPLFGRIICAAFYNGKKAAGHIIPKLNDEMETKLIEWIFRHFQDGDRIMTWNGKGFDFDFLFKRAMILGIDIRAFDLPPITAYIKRNSDIHIDLMVEWDWRNFMKLDTVAKILLGEGKDDIDFKDFPELMTTKSGREKILSYCITDTVRTFDVGVKMQDFLFV